MTVIPQLQLASTSNKTLETHMTIENPADTDTVFQLQGLVDTLDQSIYGADQVLIEQMHITTGILRKAVAEIKQLRLARCAGDGGISGAAAGKEVRRRCKPLDARVCGGR